MKRASGSTSSRRPGRQKKRQASSKPSGAPSSWLVTCARPDSGRKLEKAPSAFSTASRSILPRRAARMIGGGSGGRLLELEAGRGAVAGEGVARGSRPSPRPWPADARRSCRSSPRRSGPRRRRCRARTVRPLASAIAAACCARSAGPRVKTPTTPVPRRARSVQVLARASGVKPSGPWVSPVHRSVYPAASARRTVSSCSRSGRVGSGRVSPQREAIAAEPSRDRHAAVSGWDRLALAWTSRGSIATAWCWEGSRDAPPDPRSSCPGTRSATRPSGPSRTPGSAAPTSSAAPAGRPSRSCAGCCCSAPSRR